MDEKIYNVLLEILEELKKKKHTSTRKRLTEEEKIEQFIDYIVNFKHLGMNKADLRAAKITSEANFKYFIDYNIEEITNRIKERHNIFLSRCVPGYYIYKKPYKNKNIGD